MLETIYVNSEDSLTRVKAGEKIYAGQPVSLDSNGELVPATASSKVYGLAKLDAADPYKNVAYGEVGAYGTGRLSVITDGLVKVSATVSGNIEVTPEGPLASVVTQKIFDDTKAYDVGDVLYVDANGLITNVPSDKKSIFGRVKKFYATEKILEIVVSPTVANEATQLA